MSSRKGPKHFRRSWLVRATEKALRLAVKVEDKVRGWRRKQTSRGVERRRLTSHVIQNGLGLGQLGLQLVQAGIEELRHAVDLLLHHTAAA